MLLSSVKSFRYITLWYITHRFKNRTTSEFELRETISTLTIKPGSILLLLLNLLISYLLKLLMYSISVWWKCRHYPPIHSHIVAPVGSIHPSKVYSWGQASAPCIINRTELSAELGLWLHLASRYTSGLRKSSSALNTETQLIPNDRTGSVSSITQKTTLDLAICLLSLYHHCWVNIRKQAVSFTTLKSCLLGSQLKADLLALSLCFSYLDWQYILVLLTAQRWRALKNKIILNAVGGAAGSSTTSQPWV